jgi:hypothetical protein
MKQIKLNIQDDKVEIVLNILNNLKSGLINSIEIDENKISSNTRYQPKLNKIYDEDEKPQGKYLSAKAYKAKLEKK